MSEPHTSESNGHRAVALTDPYQAFEHSASEAMSAEAARIESLLADERATHERIAALMAASKQRMHQLERAHTALTGETPPAKKKHAPKPVDPETGERKLYISDERRDAITSALIEGKDTAVEIAEILGTSEGSAKQALLTLRKLEVIRVARQDDFGTHYALMPDAANA